MTSGNESTASARFEELDRRETPMGEIVLRRRWEPALHVDVYEVKLGDEFLMSSLFTVSEIAVATLALATFPSTQTRIDVVIGGLGLGYTAGAVLEDSRVTACNVVEALPEVVGWHEDHLLPFARALTDDPRCRLTPGDFFAMVATGDRLATDGPERWHAILVDIDHTPRHHLHPSHAPFYDRAGLRRLVRYLHPGGVFALWSDDPPDGEFMAALAAAFDTCASHVVTFPNPYTDGESACTVYVAGVAD